MSHLVITIGCEYGAKGNQIGRKIAEDLGFQFYDRNIVDAIIHEVGIPGEIMEKVEEGVTIVGKGAEGEERGEFSQYADLTKRAIHVQKTIIRKLSDRESCVIIGRSADYILKEHKPILRVFIYSPDEVRIKNVMESHKVSEKEAKQIILENLDRSPMYSGKIEGKGPRYCPSFEDKIVRFKDKERHQLFIEPCGLETEEMYLQGLSSSLPEDVQLAFIHTIPGLEHAQVMRTAYAIEYDCVDPTALNATLEFNSIKGLYGAGQFNGSSGYEEAAAQGLVAGINAALKIKGEEPMILDRGGSYIGTLIDDLVTKGCTDPYRMMTSRSEYRLVLRQDNADVRLTPIGYKIGLISQERYDKFISKEEMVKAERERIEQKSIPLTDALQKIMEDCGTTPLERGCKMIELLKRPQITYKALTSVDDDRPDLPRAVFEQVEIAVKYEGYIKRQEQQIKEMRRIECKKIPADIDYYSLKGLRLEAVEKLSKIKPENLGQASRISGVNPADIAALNIILETL